MVSVVIKDNGEPNVIQFTFEHLFHELKDIPGSELLIKSKWDISDIKNRFVCFVEPDCLVSEGYFKKQLEAFSKLSPRVILLASATAANYWNNRFYGYYLTMTGTVPNRHPKANNPYPLQVAYIPGALIRTSSLKKVLSKLETKNIDEDLVYYSSRICFNIWNNGIKYDPKHPDGQLGTQIYINPKATYVTTEEYVNDIGNFNEPMEGNLMTLFTRESI